MMEDRTFIQCSCGFEGSSEIRDKDTEIGKASVICPECMRIHIVKIGQRGVKRKMAEEEWCPFSTNRHGDRQYPCHEKCGLYDKENQCCSLVTISKNLSQRG